MSHEVKQEPKKRYGPDPRLETHLTKFLQFFDEQEKCDAARTELPDESSRLSALRANKTRLVDEIIFPSMANLLFFFLMIEKSPKLEREYDDYMKDLLGVRVIPNSKEYQRFGIYAKPMIFESLISAILQIRKEEADFRVMLADRLQTLIRYKMDFAKPFKSQSELQQLMLTGLTTAQMWTKVCAAQVDEDMDLLANRVMDFKYYP
jgi:hypothetical protein